MATVTAASVAIAVTFAAFSYGRYGVYRAYMYTKTHSGPYADIVGYDKCVCNFFCFFFYSCFPFLAQSIRDSHSLNGFIIKYQSVLSHTFRANSCKFKIVEKYWNRLKRQCERKHS